MKCTACNEAIPFHTEHVRVMVLRLEGLTVSRKWHCQHHPFDEADWRIIAIFGN